MTISLANMISLRTISLLLAVGSQGRLSASTIVTIQGEELTDLGRFGRNTIDLTRDGQKAFLYVRLCPWSLLNEDGIWMVNMTRYCYCTQSKKVDLNHETCSFPGPTLLMHSYTTVNVTLVNELVGTNCTYLPNSSDCPSSGTYWNKFKDLDTTNLHVHGLHVSPFVDDIIFAKVGPIPFQNELVPPQQWSYVFDIDFHYPGTFWYHSHHHGSTTWMVNMGLHGAILMNPWDDMKYPADGSIYEDKIYNISQYEQHVLMFEWMYAIGVEWCGYNYVDDRGDTCTSDANGLYTPQFTEFTKRPAKFDRHGVTDDFSMCDIYCESPAYQRSNSEYKYDVRVNNATSSCVFAGHFNKTKAEILNPTRNAYKQCMYFLVNGQYQPKIYGVRIGEYHRLRMINSMSNWYMLMTFPKTCNWYLIATDGTYITEEDIMNYDLSSASHQNELLISPGGRADVLFTCHYRGTHTITSSRNTDMDPIQLEHVGPIAYSGAQLFSIIVEDGDTIVPTPDPTREPTASPIKKGSASNTDSPTTSPTVSPTPMHLPDMMDYPPKPNGSYIENFCAKSSEIPVNCSQNNDQCRFDLEIVPGEGQHINDRSFLVLDNDFNFRDLIEAKELNLAIFEGSSDGMGQGQQFIINNGPRSHVFHQHINPFQVTHDVGKNGFIALRCTWWDALGNYGGENKEYDIVAKTWNRGYWTAPRHIEDRYFGKGGGLIIVHCHLLQHEDKGMMGFYGIINRDNADISTENTKGHSTLSTDNTVVMVIIIVVVLLIICIAISAAYCRHKRGSATEANADTDSADVSGDDAERSGLIE